MVADTPSRKLTAIFFADVAGYSRLTGEDELGTHRRVMSALDVAAEQVGTGGGTVLRYAGDAVLAEFPSVVAATEAAISIQTELAHQDVGIAETERIELRIGVHLGEVIEDRGEIFGDGVNIAARLEAAAPPGGICISAAVREQVDGRISTTFEDVGERQFKNIARPVRVHVWHPTGTVTTGQTEQPSLPDKPSIAVLPFDNLSADPDQEFFADGVTEDIITELSRNPDLFVIARNSTFAYKGKSPDIRQVAQELGVHFVLEGSVRRGGNRIRLTSQLIDAEANHHLWAERYDRDLDDLFEVQDELTTTITNSLTQTLRDSAIERTLRRPPENMGAYDHYLRALGLNRRLNKADNERAHLEADKALELEPTFGRAHVVRSDLHVNAAQSGWVENTREAFEASRAAAVKALACDSNDAMGHSALGFAEFFLGNFDRALSAIDRARELDSNNADIM